MTGISAGSLTEGLHTILKRIEAKPRKIVETAVQSMLQKLFQLTLSQPAFQNIPGPAPIFPIGNVLELQKGKPIWQVLGEYGQQYGGLSLFWIFGRPSLVLNDPDFLQQVLLTTQQQTGANTSKHRASQADFYKDLPRKALRPILTDSHPFVAKDAGPKWQHLVKNNPFNMTYFREWLETQVQPLQAFVETRAEELVKQSEGEMLPAYDVIQKLAFDGFSLATVGQVFPDPVFEQFNTLCTTGTDRMNRSSIASWMIPENPKGKPYKEVSRQWFSLFGEVVEKAQAKPSGGSLLDWVLTRGGSAFTPEQMRNFCAGVYPGGAVSAPSGITSTLHLLFQHPQELSALQQDLEALFRDPLTLERLENCVAVEQVLRESLRLWPPVPFFTRNTVCDRTIHLDGQAIPANTQIFITNWFLQRLSPHWQESESFKPERWDANTLVENDYGSDYFFPFGRGERACIGQDFAKFFMRLTLATLLAKVEVQFGNHPHDQEFYFGVSVPRQLKARFVLRES
ncbi:cytochrome P450 [Acaryochloris sp. IP29b_bin.137]|uniref:cytochrome P450 n=1 Tax=Acaryochloris sp. IP29b_bin.137 TaxID=2969217 RepID=UPI00263983B5|nr:cytochrome P450 [Acaryochloris sp. IP29b_bin.137]